MKKNNLLLTLLLVLAVLCTLTAIVSTREKKQEKIRADGQTILEVSPDCVDWISWKYGSTQLSFRKDGQWYYEDDTVFPVDGDKIEKALSVFDGLRAAFTVEAPEHPEDYGLGNPQCTITFSAGEDIYSVALGDFSTLDSQRYVSIGDGNVYLVTSDPMDAFQKSLSDFVLDDVIPDFYKMAEMRFFGEDTYSIHAQRENEQSICAEDRYFSEQGGTAVPMDSTLVEEYLQTLENISLGEYVTYHVTDSELAAYGLAQPDVRGEIDFTTENGDSGSFVFSLGQNQEEREKAQKDENTSVTCYLRIGDSGIIYPITQSKYDALMKYTYHSLRHQKLVTADLDTVTAMDITMDGKTYILTQEDGIFSFLGEQLPEETVAALRTAIKSMGASEFTQESPTGKLEIQIVYHLDNADFPELTVGLYRKDGSNCLAVVNGSPLALVSRTALVDLTEAVNTIILG